MSWKLFNQFPEIGSEICCTPCYNRCAKFGLWKEMEKGQRSVGEEFTQFPKLLPSSVARHAITGAPKLASEIATDKELNDYVAHKRRL